MLESFKGLMKTNKTARIVSIAVLVGIVFSFVCWRIGDSGSHFELVGSFLYLGSVSPDDVLYYLSRGKLAYAMSDLAQMAFALFYCLLFLVVKAAPFLMLVASTLESNKRSSKHWIVASLVVWVASFVLALFLPMLFIEEWQYGVLYPSAFLVIAATLAVFLLCLLTIEDEKAPMFVVAALIAVSCFLVIAKMPPFGDSSGIVLSNLIQYCAFWVTCAGAIQFSKRIPLECGRSIFKGEQKKKNEAVSSSSEPTGVSNFFDDAESIKQLKVLCDEGAITQEEFDRKKKQILDL